MWDARRVESAYAWKRYYAAERARLGTGHLHELLDAAPPLAVPDDGAVVLPHTRLEVTGDQIAAAASGVVASGADRVLAIGVLHGARRADADRVAAARSGDTVAVRELRGIHTEDGLAAEEFSLDGFIAMLGVAAQRAGHSIDVLRRYPFLAGADPATLPGLDELAALRDAGTPLVVTTDPMHHGHAYGAAPNECVDASDPATVGTVRGAVDAQFELLADHRFTEFQEMAARHRSDFRDSGPVMAVLVGAGFRWAIHDLALVDYSAALDAPSPSWVAGALCTVDR
jgi:hypothetical protein